MAGSLPLREVVALLAMGQDNAFGQPLESQFRSCVLARWIADAQGGDAGLTDTVHWVALLRYLGCTGHAHEVSALFGDEIALRARTLVHDVANTDEVVADLIDFVASDPARLGLVTHVLGLGRVAIAPNFAAGCEVGDALAARLGMSPAVRSALRCTFERWNGHGFPDGVAGEDIPLAMRVVHLSHDMEAIARLRSPTDALAAAVERRDRTYDPALVDVFVARGERWLEDLAALDPWVAVRELEPGPHRVLAGDEVDEVLSVVADFVDLKSPFMAGHSRRCAALTARAAGLLGLDAARIEALHRAALVHDLGITAIPNSIWDKPGGLSTAERDRVEVHPMLTVQMLRRCASMPDVGAIAGAHHERSDGSGYHRGVRLDAGDPAGSVLAAADVYVGLTADRADRPAWTVEDATAELTRLATKGLLHADAVSAVLAAAGRGRRRRPNARVARPGGLTAREVQVLRLVAEGLPVKVIAERLVISPKTADHHVQHIYTKIGVSSRAAAALWAMHHGMVS